MSKLDHKSKTHACITIASRWYTHACKFTITNHLDLYTGTMIMHIPYVPAYSHGHVTALCDYI